MLRCFEVHLGNMLKSQTFQEAGLLWGQVWCDILILLTSILLLLHLLFFFLHLLDVAAGGLVRVGAALVEVQGRPQRECFVTTIADKTMKLADAPTKVCLAPDLQTSHLNTNQTRIRVILTLSEEKINK